MRGKVYVKCISYIYNNNICADIYRVENVMIKDFVIFIPAHNE